MKKIVFIAIAVIIIPLVAFVVYRNMNRIPVQPMAEILKEIEDNVGAEGNVFPDDIIEVQFKDFKMPDENSNELRQGFRLENITDKPINMRVWAYYDKTLDDYIIARFGDITAESKDSPLPVIEIRPKSGYIVSNSTSLLFDYSKYSKEDMEKVRELAPILYVRVEIDGKNYYFKLDMENSKVIV